MVVKTEIIPARARGSAIEIGLMALVFDRAPTPVRGQVFSVMGSFVQTLLID